MSDTTPMQPQQDSVPDISHPWIWGVPLLAIILFAAITLLDVNHSLFFAINSRSAVLGERFWSHATLLGDTLVALSLLLPFALRRPDIAWTALLGGFIAALWVHGLKWPLDMPRPGALFDAQDFNLIGRSLASSPAFPSGHTATAALIAGAIAMNVRKLGLGLFVIGLALLVGWSRMAVGVHWPQDVAAGLLVGWLSAWMGAAWAQNWGALYGRIGRVFLIGLLATCAVSLFFHNSGYPQARSFQFAVGAVTLLLTAQALLARRRRP